MQQRAGTDPEIGDEFAEQAAELQRARDRVMLTRTELAAEPLHQRSYIDMTYIRFAGTGARRSAR